MGSGMGTMDKFTGVGESLTYILMLVDVLVVMWLCASGHPSRACFL